MEYDNARGRENGGFDAGTIVDGIVTWDPALSRFVLLDDDGVGFDPQAALTGLMGKRVRMTMVSFEAIENIERLLKEQGVEVTVDDLPGVADGGHGQE